MGNLTEYQISGSSIGMERPHYPYSTSNKEQPYRESIVAFIDVLGYSEFIKSKKESPDEVYKAIEHVGKAFEPTKEKRVNFFSDSIIISVPLGEDENENAKKIKDFIVYLGNAQKYILEKTDLLIRGAVTIGDIVHEGRYVFGTGLLEAYKLEREKKFPRIFIDINIILQRVKGSTISNLLYQASNGECSIDYIGIAIGDQLTGYEAFLKWHSEKIRKGLRDKDSGVLAKYLWLNEYHNGAANEHIRRRCIDRSAPPLNKSENYGRFVALQNFQIKDK